MTDPRVYVAAFQGQGGGLTSIGIWARITPRLIKLGCAVDVFGYKQVQLAHRRIDEYRAWNHRVVLLGYSLGTSSATYLQRQIQSELTLCIAMSSLESAWPIDHKLTRRSVLWHGPGLLSDAGLNLGFDEVHEVKLWPIPLLGHLFMDLSGEVVDGVVGEVQHLADSFTGGPNVPHT